MEIRFPYAMLAVLVAAGLSMVGASLQAVIRNPLADPHLMGISARGVVGAVLALLHTGLIGGLFFIWLLGKRGAQ